MSTRQVAQRCLRGGFAPWWVVTRNKVPVDQRWGTAPASPDRIANLREGEEAGLVPGSIQHRVVDVDRKDDRKVRIAWQDLQPLLEALGPPSWSMRSLSGKGWHLWYRTSRRMAKANNVRYAGLTMDVIDSKGYVVMTDPSAVFEKDLEALPVVDDWTALVQKPAVRPQPVRSPTVGDFADRPAVRNKARIREAVAMVRAAPEGARNVTVNREAFIVGLCGGSDLDLLDLIAALPSSSTFQTVEGDKVARRAFAAGRAARSVA